LIKVSKFNKKKSFFHCILAVVKQNMMFKYVIGLMSGTSLDGLDMVYVKFDTENLSNFDIIQAETIPYSEEWAQKLKQAFDISAVDLARLDALYGNFLGKQIKAFIEKNSIKQVDLIASHGQTIFHQPEEGFTTQIGNGPQINVVTGIKTICDFRTQDVALGGQGAPLVPIGDRLLFGQYDYCLNIGGFANISFEQDGKRLAYDICPTNIVLNHYVQKMGLSYDDRGKLAATGRLNKDLLNDLNELDFYTLDQPKSLGWEFVTGTIMPMIDAYQMTIPDILNTYTEHIAIQIARKTGKGSLLITGGGAFNDYMIERIKALTNAEVIIPEKQLIDFKEALIFALLGLLKDENKVNVLSSVTGSRTDHSSGVVYDYKKLDFRN
jgi:anhydro-N-acetylmuramic acid kinase